MLLPEHITARKMLARERFGHPYGPVLSITFLSPIRDDLFVGKNYKLKREPHRGDLFVN